MLPSNLDIATVLADIYSRQWHVLLIPDVLSNSLNFVSLHGPLVSLRGLKKIDRVITSLFTACARTKFGDSRSTTLNFR